MIADHGCGDATLKAVEPRCVYATFGAKHYHTSHPFHSGGPFTKFTSLATSPCGPPSPAGHLDTGGFSVNRKSPVVKVPGGGS